MTIKWFALAAGLAVPGWGGLCYLLTSIYPTPWARAGFVGLTGMALAGTAWPVLLAANRRLNPAVAPARVWRQCGWVAAFGMLAVWLQMDRILSLSMALLVAGTFGLFEVLLILRERMEPNHEGTHNGP